MSKDTSSLFGFLSDEISELIDELIENSGLDEAEVEDAISPIFEKFIAESTPSFAAALLKGSKSMLRDRRAVVAGFQKRNLKRWAKSFSRIELIWHLSEEIGREYDQKYRLEAVEEHNMLFEALVGLHARGLLVAAEAIQLLKGGFAEGALTRWRALHEVLVVSMFIREHGPMAAERYLHSAHFRSLEATRQYLNFQDRAKLLPMEESDLVKVVSTCKVLADKYGPSMYKEYGWAQPFFAERISEVWSPWFNDLEEAVGLDHWRPYYKWSSQHSHAGSRHVHSNLGLVESETAFLLVGPSNSGMVGPIQLVSLHLWSLTSTLLLSNPSLEGAVFANVLHHLVADIGDLSIAEEQSSFHAAMAARSA